MSTELSKWELLDSEVCWQEQAFKARHRKSRECVTVSSVIWASSVADMMDLHFLLTFPGTAFREAIK